MHKLTSSELAEIEQQLRSMRIDIGERIWSQLRSGYGAGTHSFSVAARPEEQAMEGTLDDDQMALIRHELGELRDVDAALQRIEFNVGGKCTVCGDQIAYARMRALPTATTCIECARGQARRSDAGPPMHVR